MCKASGRNLGCLSTAPRQLKMIKTSTTPYMSGSKVCLVYWSTQGNEAGLFATPWNTDKGLSKFHY